MLHTNIKDMLQKFLKTLWLTLNMFCLMGLVYYQNRNHGKLLLIKCKNKRTFSSLLLFAFMSK